MLVTPDICQTGDFFWGTVKYGRKYCQTQGTLANLFWACNVLRTNIQGPFVFVFLFISQSGRDTACPQTWTPTTSYTAAHTGNDDLMCPGSNLRERTSHTLPLRNKGLDWQFNRTFPQTIQWDIVHAALWSELLRGIKPWHIRGHNGTHACHCFTQGSKGSYSCCTHTCTQPEVILCVQS